jgi:manganese/iron transport system ATP-binding protein
MAFGGVLRHFILGGDKLHADDDKRQLTVITDDERPFVLYGGEQQVRRKQKAGRSTGRTRRKVK